MVSGIAWLLPALSVFSGAMACAIQHNLTIVITADNYYELYLQGGKTFEGPKDNQQGESWKQIRKYTEFVKCNGPWLVAVKVESRGALSGLFAAVYLDGKPYSATGTKCNKIVMTPETPQDGWNVTVAYDDSEWHEQKTDVCESVSAPWGDMMEKLKEWTPQLAPRAMWYPTCKSDGNPTDVKHMYYRLVIKPPPKPQEEEKTSGGEQDGDRRDISSDRRYDDERRHRHHHRHRGYDNRRYEDDEGDNVRGDFNDKPNKLSKYHRKYSRYLEAGNNLLIDPRHGRGDVYDFAGNYAEYDSPSERDRYDGDYDRDDSARGRRGRRHHDDDDDEEEEEGRRHHDGRGHRGDRDRYRVERARGDGEDRNDVTRRVAAQAEDTSSRNDRDGDNQNDDTSSQEDTSNDEVPAHHHHNGPHKHYPSIVQVENLGDDQQDEGESNGMTQDAASTNTDSNNVVPSTESTIVVPNNAVGGNRGEAIAM